MAVVYLLTEFRWRINGWIDFPPQGLFGCPHRADDIPKGDVADYHDVQVARRCQLIPRRRPIKERHIDPRLERSQRLAKNASDSGRLDEQRG
jgi:hypothetical protein